MKLALTTSVSFLLLAVAALLFAGSFSVKPVEASAFTATNIGAVATTTAATSITTSARIMATTTNPLDGENSYTRVYAVICNANANPVWINMDGDKAANLPTGNVTTVIAAAAGYNACFEIKDYNQYSGSVTASSTNQTATTITVKQYVSK